LHGAPPADNLPRTYAARVEDTPGEMFNMNVSGSDEEEESVPRRARTRVDAPAGSSAISVELDPLLDTMNRSSQSSTEDIEYFFKRFDKKKEPDAQPFCIRCT
jgi:hypothetical protein